LKLNYKITIRNKKKPNSNVRIWIKNGVGTWIHAGRQNQPQKEKKIRNIKFQGLDVLSERLEVYSGAWKLFLEA
jgi:hypothetical protein